MILNIHCPNEFKKGLEELAKEFDFEIGNSDIKVFIEKSEEDKVLFINNAYHIYYTEDVYAFRMFFHVLTRYKINRYFDYNFEFKAEIEKLTFMLDCSRNAVMKLDSLKRLIRYLACMGYNGLMLYTEDTYEVKDYPYFGYLRTPYKKEDIKEIDAYCKLFGIELIPCIQTLAHFNSIVRYPSMNHLFDCDDILLIGEDETYKFIEELIKTCKECFSSNKIHIGMDEAHMVGRGKYLDKFGYHERGELMNYHVKRVLDICAKYNLDAMMWSDMYVSLATGASNVSKDKLKEIPDGIELIYWDYYHTNVAHYENVLNIHKRLDKKIGFAGGAWKWLGFTPDNRYSNIEIDASMRACKLTNTNNYILTAWGDNGAETSPFAVLPAIFYASLARYNYLDLDKDINKLVFNNEFMLFSDGITYDDYMKLDLANRITHNDDFNEKNSANKYLLFNDILLGTLDTIIDDNITNMYLEHIEEFEKVNYQNTKFGYLFTNQLNLCKVLSKKAHLGIDLRRDYKANNKAGLKEDLSKLKELLPLIEEFYNSFNYQWHLENRANGFDVQDIRIGALEKRIKVAIKKLSDYLEGKTKVIEELEEELLCFNGHDKDFEKDYDNCEYRWRRMTSVNVND